MFYYLASNFILSYKLILSNQPDGKTYELLGTVLPGLSMGHIFLFHPIPSHGNLCLFHPIPQDFHHNINMKYSLIKIIKLLN